MHYIYSISIDNKIVYIGRTKKPSIRLWEHTMYGLNASGGAFYEYMNKRMLKDDVPVMRILYQCQDEVAPAVEAAFIKRYSSIYNLFNGTHNTRKGEFKINRLRCERIKRQRKNEIISATYIANKKILEKSCSFIWF